MFLKICLKHQKYMAQKKSVVIDKSSRENHEQNKKTINQPHQYTWRSWEHIVYIYNLSWKPMYGETIWIFSKSLGFAMTCTIWDSSWKYCLCIVETYMDSTTAQMLFPTSFGDKVRSLFICEIGCFYLAMKQFLYAFLYFAGMLCPLHYNFTYKFFSNI